MAATVLERGRTEVVVLGDGGRGAGARALLGEVVAELDDAAALLQHLGDLHLHRGAQLLPLRRRERKESKRYPGRRAAPRQLHVPRPLCTYVVIHQEERLTARCWHCCWSQA